MACNQSFTTMNSDLLTVIIAHGNGRAAFNRHEKYWRILKSPMLVVSPVNDPLESDCENLFACEAEHSGSQASQRLIYLMKVLSDRNWNRCILFEYDSFLIEPRLPEGPGLHGVLFSNSEAPKFQAPVYANPPWYFDRWTFENMMATAERYPKLTEGGVADRYFSALCHFAGMPLFPFDPPGYSRGTICHEDVTTLRQAIKQGAYAFHGIKSAWVLTAIEQFWDEEHPHA